MSVYERIKLMRQAKNWTQEEIAHKLEMSVNGYADIERGQTDIKLSRLEQIASLFGLTLAELLGTGENNIFLMGTNNSGTQHNQNHCAIHTPSSECLELKAELEKLQLIIAHNEKLLEMKNQEILYLKEINTHMKKHGEG